LEATIREGRLHVVDHVAPAGVMCAPVTRQRAVRRIGAARQNRELKT